MRSKEDEISDCLVLLLAMAEVERNLKITDSLSVADNGRKCGVGDLFSGFDVDAIERAEDIELEVEERVSTGKLDRVLECWLQVAESYGARLVADLQDGWRRGIGFVDLEFGTVACGGQADNARAGERERPDTLL